jgi:TolB-like protein
VATIHQIGPFRLDAETGIVFRNAEPLALGQRAVALLRALVERAGAPVSKAVLIDAAWSGLAVEESNLTAQIAALRRVFREEPGGERWIETLPRRGYRFVGPVVATRNPSQEEGTEVKPALLIPDKPSIAVLPFENMSGDPDQEYFADGVVEEIITALSRFRALFVIARNSSFTYKGRRVDTKQIGRELGVRYVLEGSVRKAARRVRITGQLVEASTGAHLWADRFEGAPGDIFDLQDQVTESVVGAIGSKLEQAEIERAKRKPTETLDAYDYYLRGLAGIHQGTRESTSEALRLFYEALDLDPEFSSAYGMAALCYDLRKWNGWVTDPVGEIAETERLARRAAASGKDDAVALCTAGFALAHVVGNLDDGAAYIHRALVLNPNFATAWHFSGWVAAYRGEPEIAIEHVSRAMRLSPLDPFSFLAQGAIAFGHFVAGRYEEAASWAHKSVREQPDFMPMVRLLASSCAMAGKLDEAQRVMARVRQLDPTFRISDIKGTTPLRRPEDLARYVEGLRRAGLPE